MLKNLRKLREEKKVTQKQLADVIGVSQQSINKYENHNIEPDLQTLMHLADYFNTSVDYLIGYSDLRHRIEAVTPYDLNEQEAEIIELYRKLSPEQKQSIFTTIRLFAQNK